MSSDIQFGDLEHSQPERGLRPDQDAHFATCPVGTLEDGELLIFVDLDVMRDMEAHAQSNTNVELGGVMLGRQSVDDQGRPFVTITDSLRAEHYEATKGSFKFTHETWSQISRQRDQFRPDLEMVGWYHTHPGWSVFLSGMDLFICNNFFNRFFQSPARRRAGDRSLQARSRLVSMEPGKYDSTDLWFRFDDRKISPTGTQSVCPDLQQRANDEYGPSLLR